MNNQYSLSELCQSIAEVLNVEFPDTYWVRAEIASLSTKGGHGYMELVEKSERSALPVARVRATCWSNIYPMLCAYFEQETGLKLQIGMQVLVEVEVNFHASYGLSLNICNIDPRFTMGDLARQRQETIRRLTEEGVIEMQRSLTLPTLIRRIAVISSESAAGWGDFCDQLQQGGYAIAPTLYPAIMQGERAEQSILEALHDIAAHEDEYDIVAIIRGGGASTDLSCFDSYLLAATCAQFPLPIITGIGHTRDVSVMDMVAHMSLKTPTAVATFVVNRLDTERNRIQELKRRLAQTAERQILIRRHRLELLRERIQSCSPERIFRMGYSLTTVDGRIVRSASDIAVGNTLTTHLSDGTVQSQVIPS